MQEWMNEWRNTGGDNERNNGNDGDDDDYNNNKNMATSHAYYFSYVS
jgi:hypothetical protein